MFRDNESKIWFVAIVVIVGCFAVVGGDYASVANAAMRKGPYLIYPGVNDEMMVLWQLTGTQTCTLEWGEDTTYSSGSVQTTEYGTNQHKYVITNLTPATKYYYRVTEDVSHTGSFLAAPSDTATGVKFFAYGDSRSNPGTFDGVNTQLINTYEADPAYQSFTMLTGDWVNMGELESEWDNQHFNRSYPNTLELQANLPINGCIGNHEWDAAQGTLFDKYYPYPYPYGADNANLYWSFDYGPAHFAVVDQYAALYDPTSAQWSWLKNDLATTTKEWKFILLHAPGYSAHGGHTDNTDVQNYIQPLCELYGVDIIFAGHNHYYARCVKNGVTHITTGGGGAGLYNPNPNYSPYIVTTAKLHYFCKIAINGLELDFMAVDKDGTMIESFTLDHYYVPALPWSDGFESGDFETGGWDTSGRYVTVQTDDVYSGTYAAEIEKSNWFQRAISTEGFSDIHVKYARKTSGLDAGEYLNVEWSVNGSDWYILESTQDTSWSYQDMTCGSGANDSHSFRVRFRTNCSVKEYAYVDEVEITGTLIYPVGDFNGSGSVNFDDLGIFTDRWLMSCSGPGWCNGCDIDESGQVDFVDFAHLASHWLEDINP